MTQERAVERLHDAFRAWVVGGTGRGAVRPEPEVAVQGGRHHRPSLAWYPTADPGTGVPDLVVEVPHRSTHHFEVLHKQHEYAVAGVRELWVVDVANGPQALVFRATGSAWMSAAEDLDADGVLTSPLLPGLRIALADLRSR
ncbi:Uma2 family endonuclease [Pseudonocardia humida]|uniref:Uma2 family endonuclease n=1 Tax=Pseudonocardia humida TaxID=2800819 RepID=A0ABT0ZUQ9_9PSEU|nr:Uma2 family endonuclease [Pseudonocardia humida]MCO1654477.1 Uma2 family endonuclease [Pseudonocardia humida]